MASKLTDSQKIQSVTDYLNGDSTWDIAKKFNVTPCCIQQLLKRRGIKRRTARENSLYTFNYSIFRDVLSEEQAYWLGFLIGDGCMTTDGKLKIELQLGDIEHLEKFKVFLNSNHKIIIPSYRNSCKLQVCSREMANDLEKFDIVHRKTYKTISAKNIPFELKRHYYRGFLDADGTMVRRPREIKNTQHYIGFSCYCKSFLVEIQNWALHYYPKVNGYITISVNNGTCYNLRYQGNQQFIKIANLLYENSSIYLDRKFKQYIDYKTYISNYTKCAA